jgi:hypothetical protein
MLFPPLEEIVSIPECPWGLEFWRISTEEWTGSGELVTSGSWATISVDPSTVIAGDETGAATLHIADGGAWSADAAWVYGGMAGGGSSRDSSNESDKAEDDGTHCV